MYLLQCAAPCLKQAADMTGGPGTVRSCDCDPGWTTSSSQDLSAFVYCGVSTVPPPPPSTAGAAGRRSCMPSRVSAVLLEARCNVVRVGACQLSLRPWPPPHDADTIVSRPSAATNSTTASTRSGVGLFLDGAMPTVAGWVVVFIAVLVVLVLLTWFLCWRRGRIGFCCGRTRAQCTRAEVQLH